MAHDHDHDGPCDHDHDHDHEGSVRLPTVFLAPEEELAEAIRGNVEFAKVQQTIEFVGDGRPVDDEGSLSDTALGELVGAIGVEDSEEAAETIHLLAAAGLLEVADGVLVVTEAGRNAPDAPLDTWWEVFSAYLGQVADTVVEGAVAEIIELTVTQALLLLYCEPEPVSQRDLLGTTWQTVRKAMDGSFDLKQDQVRKAMKEVVEETVTQVMGGLESMGAVRVVGDERNALTLAPLGVWGSRKLFLDGPFEAPVVGDLQLEDADDLLEGLTDMRAETADAELRLWTTTRGEATAVKELVAAAQGSASPGLAVMAIYALGTMGEHAEPAVRQLLDTPAVKPLAYAWLVDQGHEHLPALSADQTPGELVDAMSLWLAVGGPSRLGTGLATLGSTSAQATLVDALWRTDSPHTSGVLEAIAEGATDKAVSKAARKALFKRRSAGQA